MRCFISQKFNVMNNFFVGVDLESAPSIFGAGLEKKYKMEKHLTNSKSVIHYNLDVNKGDEVLFTKSFNRPLISKVSTSVCSKI